jgi:signal transduction histidine kinase
MSWVIENLVKNAVDAMKGEGAIVMSVFERNKNILIEVKDSGSGMTKQQARNAFKPGILPKTRLGIRDCHWQKSDSGIPQR